MLILTFLSHLFILYDRHRAFFTKLWACVNSPWVYCRNDIVHVSGGQDWKAMLQKQVVGQIVMTKRPVKTYRIDDIEFNQTPSSTFTMSNGKTVSNKYISSSNLASRLGLDVY